MLFTENVRGDSFPFDPQFMVVSKDGKHPPTTDLHPLRSATIEEGSTSVPAATYCVKTSTRKTPMRPNQCPQRMWFLRVSGWRALVQDVRLAVIG